MYAYGKTRLGHIYGTVKLAACLGYKNESFRTPSRFTSNEKETVLTNQYPLNY